MHGSGDSNSRFKRRGTAEAGEINIIGLAVANRDWLVVFSEDYLRPRLCILP